MDNLGQKVILFIAFIIFFPIGYRSIIDKRLFIKGRPNTDLKGTQAIIMGVLLVGMSILSLVLMIFA